MPRIARLTDALRHRGNALVFVGAAAALVGAGSATAASAATVAQPGHPAVVTDAAVAAPSLGAADNAGAVSLGGQGGTPSLGASAAGTPLASADQAQQPAAPLAASHGSAQQAAAQQPAAPAQQAAAPVQQAAAQPAQQAPRQQYSYEIYDSTTPNAIPGNHVVATYATGNFAVPASQVSGDKAVVWIDTNGTDSHAAALDIEPGDMTPSQAPAWVQARLHYDPSGTAILYTMRSDWSQVQSAVSTLPHWMQAHIRWWIADPTGSPHMVPGANATQWYWGTNYDISTANPGF